MSASAATGAQASAQVTTAVRGDPAYVDGWRRVVQPACGAVCPKAFCLTCRQVLANVFQAHAHTETGTHVIASLCELHGPEEVARP